MLNTHVNTSGSMEIIEKCTVVRLHYLETHNVRLSTEQSLMLRPEPQGSQPSMDATLLM